MFNIQMVKLDAGSYLCMTLEKAIAKAEKEIRTYTFRLAWRVEGLLFPRNNLQIEYLDHRYYPHRIG